MTLPEGFDPGALDLSIDLDGNWRHQNEVITHPRILAMLFLGLKKMGPAYVICVEDLCIPVEVADCAYVVLSVRHLAEGVSLLLTDGTHEMLDPETLTVDAQNVPRAQVKNGEFQARFSRPAWMQLAEQITGNEQDGYLLHAAGRAHTLKLEAQS